MFWMRSASVYSLIHSIVCSQLHTCAYVNCVPSLPFTVYVEIHNAEMCCSLFFTLCISTTPKMILFSLSEYLQVLKVFQFYGGV